LANLNNLVTTYSLGPLSDENSQWKIRTVFFWSDVLQWYCWDVRKAEMISSFM